MRNYPPTTNNYKENKASVSQLCYHYISSSLCFYIFIVVCHNSLKLKQFSLSASLKVIHWQKPNLMNQFNVFERSILRAIRKFTALR